MVKLIVIMNKDKKIAAYILCGGTNKRMGTEKGLIAYNGKTFIEWIIDAVKPIINSIFLITKNEDYKQFGYPMIADIVPDKGPVGGIYTALKHSNSERNLILSSDIPSINTSVLNKFLIDKRDDATDVTLVADDNKEYPLIGIYSKHLVDDFESAVENNHLKLMDLLSNFKTECIKVNPEDYDALKNVNTKAELIDLFKNKKA